MNKVWEMLVPTSADAARFPKTRITDWKHGWKEF